MSPYATAVTFVMLDAPVTRGFSSPSYISPVSASARKSSSK